MNCNRNYLVLFLAFFSQTISVLGQFAPEKIKGGVFIENKGQWDANVLYRSEIPSGQLYIEKNRFLFNFYDAVAGHHSHGSSNIQNTSNFSSEKTANNGRIEHTPESFKGHAYEVSFLGCSPASFGTGMNPTSYSHNYLKGDDQSKWGRNAKVYGQVLLNDIYPNTSLVCFGQETGFKYEFHLAAQADPALIQLKYNGVDSVYLKNGELFIETSVTDFYEQKPFAYQQTGETRTSVPCEFRLVNNVLSFVFPKGYNKRLPLVIDPQLIFSTYSGSTADNWGNSATYDDYGNTYMVGIAFDQGYPATTGSYQVRYNGYEEIVPDTLFYTQCSIVNFQKVCIDTFYAYTYSKFDPDIAIMKFDPVGNLLYATYLGGSETDMPSSCIVNSKHELVLLGVTSSDGLSDFSGHTPKAFPTTNGAYDRTFNGGRAIMPFGKNEPIFFDHGSDIFICALSEQGNALTHSTFIGGDSTDGLSMTREPINRNYGDQLRGEIFCDELDNVYIVSKTLSSDIINTSVPGYDKTLDGKMDAYVAKLSADLTSMYWNTFIGGGDYDAGYSIRVAVDKSVYITGGTTSTDFPGVAAGIKTALDANDTDGFIAHISADGASLLHATYIGTSSYDQCFFIQFDALENIYVLGQTQGNYPMSLNVYGQPSTGQFIQKISPDLSSSLLSTTIGNKPNTICLVPTAFLVNNCDNLLISGWGGNVNSFEDENNISNYIGGNTFNLPTTPNALYSYTDGSDFYLMVLEKNASGLLYATYYGGYGEDDHVDGGTSRFDKNGIVYQSVCASCWTHQINTSNFPTTSGAFATRKGSLNCNNACFKYDLSSLKANFIMDPVSGCGPTTVTLTNTSIGGLSFEWDLGDGTKINGPGPVITHSYPNPGNYIIKLIAVDLTTCIGKDTATKILHVYAIPGIGVTLSDTTICKGDTISVLHSCNPYYTYSWTPAIEMLNPSVCSAKFFPSTTRDYYLTVTDTTLCVYKDTVTVNVSSLAHGINWENLSQCKGKPTIHFSNPSIGKFNYLWTFGDGSSSIESSPVHEYAKGDSYAIVLDVYNDYCASTEKLFLTLDDVNIPNLFTPNGDGHNDCFEIKGLYENWNVEVYNAWSKRVFKSDSYKNDFCGDNLSSSVYYYLVCPPNGNCCKSWVQIIKD